MSIINFEKRDHLTGLPTYHHAGNILTSGMKLIFERNFRSKLIEVELLTWNVGSVASDLTGFGKYSVSSTVCLVNGVETKIPFSMLYIKPEEND